MGPGVPARGLRLRSPAGKMPYRAGEGQLDAGFRDVAAAPSTPERWGRPAGAAAGPEGVCGWGSVVQAGVPLVFQEKRVPAGEEMVETIQLS